MQKTKKTIEEVLNSGLCTGCGTCVGLCPKSAIYITKTKEGYIPKLNKSECVKCGICFEVCPGFSIDFKKLNFSIFGKESQDILMGNYMNCYVGHAADSKIRYNSTSGGLITSLLVFALEEGIIDGALVTKMNNKLPLEPEVFIAKTKDEIISASKSKYCPVPANTALKEIIRENGNYAIVGLPCHIQGIRKAELINEQLAKKIVLHLGLICNHTPTFLATEYLLKKMKLRKDDVKKLDYRGEGWPGGMSIVVKNGEKNFISQFNPYYWGHVFNSYFFPTRCILCNDKIAELSDISFGDAWDLSNCKIGESVAISRSRTGEDLLKKAMMKKKIELKRVDYKQIVKSQALDIVKRRYQARNHVFKTLGKSVPFSNQEMLQSKVSDYVKALLLCFSNYVSSKPYLWNLINIRPFLLARLKDLRNS